MKILKIKQINNCCFITIKTKNFDASNYNLIKSKLLNCIEEYNSIVLDLSLIDNLDSIGIGVLISINAKLKGNQKFIILCPKLHIYEQLKSSGLINYFNVIYSQNINFCPLCKENSCEHIDTICNLLNSQELTEENNSSIKEFIKKLTSNLDADILKEPQKIVKSLTNKLKLDLDKSPTIKTIKKLTGKLDETIFKKKQKFNNEAKNYGYTIEVNEDLDNINETKEEEFEQQEDYSDIEEYELESTTKNKNLKKYVSIGVFIIFIGLFIFLLLNVKQDPKYNKNNFDLEEIIKGIDKQEALLYDIDNDGVFTKKDWYKLDPTTRYIILQKYIKRGNK